MATKKTKKTKKKPGVYRITDAQLERWRACSWGREWFRRYAKGRRAVVVTKDQLIEKANAHTHTKTSEYARWLLDTLRLTYTYNEPDGGGLHFIVRGRARGFREEARRGWVELDNGQCFYWRPEGHVPLWRTDSQLNNTITDADMPETYHAAVRAARQRLDAQGGAGVVSSQPTAS